MKRHRDAVAVALSMRDPDPSPSSIIRSSRLALRLLTRYSHPPPSCFDSRGRSGSPAAPRHYYSLAICPVILLSSRCALLLCQLNSSELQ